MTAINVTSIGAMQVDGSGSFGSANNSVSGTTQAKLTVPVGTKWLVKSIFCYFGTSSTAGNRQFNIFIQEISTSDNVFSMEMPFTQGATQNWSYSLAPRLPLSGADGAGNNNYSPMPELCLGPGSTINTNTTGLVTG